MRDAQLDRLMNSKHKGKFSNPFVVHASTLLLQSRLQAPASLPHLNRMMSQRSSLDIPFALSYVCLQSHQQQRHEMNSQHKGDQRFCHVAEIKFPDACAPFVRIERLSTISAATKGNNELEKVYIRAP